MAAAKQLKIADIFSRLATGQKRAAQPIMAVASASQLCQDDPAVAKNGTTKKEQKLEPPSKKIKGATDAESKENLEPTRAASRLESESEKNGGRSESAEPLDPAKKCSTVGELIRDSLVESGWRKILEDELNKSYVQGIFNFLDAQYKKSVKVFPPRECIFNAFNLTPFNEVRVVLIGQDPYHNDGQAHGLCFSVPKGVPPPPSLKNIYKELAVEFADFRVPDHGCLLPWASQGVFMLNATLTVEAHKANSHSAVGWQKFTDAVIRAVSQRSERPVVFLLWGGFAHKKAALIDAKRHRVIKTAHPSPLSFHKFKGSCCFTRTNEALRELGREAIEWNSL